MIKAKCTGKSRIPLQYNNAFSSAIYNLLKLNSSEFAAFLKEAGFTDNKFDLFSFAVKLDEYFIDEHSIYLISPQIFLFISLPLITSFIQEFVLGTLHQQSFMVNDNLHCTSFSIYQVEIFPEPEYDEEMKFYLLSPIILSVNTRAYNRTKNYYLKPSDNEKINEVLTKDLANKYRRIYNKELEEYSLNLIFDKEYIDRHDGVIKKVTIENENNHLQDTYGIKAPFTLIGNPELIKVGYECGFGELNHLGFGLAAAKKEFKY